jgi:methylated-DNA-[protein]-cysteine S-methyltransferase
MPATGFTLCDTAIGPCGIAWGPRGIAGVQLPERHATATRERLQRRYPGVPEAQPPPEVQRVIDDIIALLRGEARELSNVVLDMEGVPVFRQRLYAALRSVPTGSTITYGDLAVRIGDGCTARDVGEAMGKNPFPIIVPCHRVMAATARWAVLCLGWRRDEAAAVEYRTGTDGQCAHPVRQLAVGPPAEAETSVSLDVAC